MEKIDLALLRDFHLVAVGKIGRDFQVTIAIIIVFRCGRRPSTSVQSVLVK